jgi:cytoskeleton protein RodZ
MRLQEGLAVGFGEKLQREREMRGITLDEIAKATKIGTRSLRALEQEDFNKLPGGIFNKGFVRAYARFLGIDEEQAVADYLAAIEEPESSTAEGEQIKKIEANWKPAPATPEAEAPSEPQHIPWVPILILIVLAVVIVLAWRFGPQGLELIKARRQSHNEQIEMAQHTTQAAYQAGAPAESSNPATAPVPSSTTPGENAAGAAGTEAVSGQQGIVVHIRTTEDSWVSVKADGKKILHGMMKANNEQTIRAQDLVVLTAGNAAGVEVSFNGVPQPSLGSANKVRTVLFTPTGIKEPSAH